MHWPFELPPPNATARRALIDDECNHRGHEEVPAYTKEQVNACIAAALRWAAEQCDDLRATGITSDAGMFVREADLIDAAVRILAALTKE